MRSDLTKDLLQELYLNQQLTPYEIAEKLSCNHKTVRNRLKAFNIPMRTASEYNYLSRETHKSPDSNKLFTPLSIAGHTAYLCEGHHTEKAAVFYFCNTEVSLIDLIVKFLLDIYEVRSIRMRVMANSKEEAQPLLNLYPNACLQLETGRVTPLVRVYSGGKYLVREVVENGYRLLSNLS